jgi:hypothetical protein
MSMTAFSQLLSVAIHHSYYADDCQDFDYLLSAESQTNLQKGRVVARSQAGSLTLVYEQFSAGVPYASLTGRYLQLGLVLHNPAFSNFTDLSATEAGTVPVYRNASSLTALDAPVNYRLFGNLLSHRFTSSSRPLTLRLKNSDGTVMDSEVFSSSDGRDGYSKDLALYPTGIYQIEEETSGGTTLTNYYREPDFQRAGVFGIVHLQVADNFYTSAAQFTIQFNARSDILKYYVVASNYTNGDVNQLSISDKGFTDGGWPEIHFNKLASTAFASDDISPELLLGSETDAKLVLFKSTAAVARREQARNNIQLKKHNEVLISNLPAPAGSRTSADVIIQISKP